MLKPAILYKDELECKFMEILYSDDFFLYTGYGHEYHIPEIKVCENLRQYVILNKNCDVIGYFGYRIEPSTNSVYNFGLYSFDKGNLTVPKDLYNELNNIINQYHRIEWRVVCGNPAEKAYDRICNKYGGTKHVLHDSTIDNQQVIRDTAIYEIITNNPIICK